MRLLDRYVLQSFLIPFVYSTFGFLAIWLVFDLCGDGHDFIEYHIGIKKLSEFYLSQFPQILVICLPVGLLLALLYSLSRMSRSNEIISMLTAGQSVMRVMLPLFIFGLITALFSLALNYQMAPHADVKRKELMDDITKGHSRSDEVDQQLFRNRVDLRTWMIQTVEKRENTLRGVDISQQDADGNIITKWYADRAVFNPADHSWTFIRGKQVFFDKDGNVLREDDSWLRKQKRITGWSETIWRILSTNDDPQDLSVPELKTYLINNGDFPEARLAPFRTHFWYRWAVPFQCLVVIFIAAPLGIVYSRRGVLAGVASCIFIFAAMGFIEKFFLALGRGDRVPALVAAWTSDVVFLLVGCYLLWLRSNNRDLPSLKIRWRR
ncbi:MAG TPA: LptF/LptG family permease [Chthoniobacteraceae bacterium]|jgi:LPS export ABC transporter permease LptG|nr:LptF/LptG family permease [Chthoniobacteraceae bacterium]